MKDSYTDVHAIAVLKNRIKIPPFDIRDTFNAVERIILWKDILSLKVVIFFPDF